MAKHKRTASMELTHVGRGAKLTIGVGRRGQLVVNGKGTFTPEEFLQWLGRATWYVNDWMGRAPSGSSTLKALPSTTLSVLPEQMSFLNDECAPNVEA